MPRIRKDTEDPDLQDKIVAVLEEGLTYEDAASLCGTTSVTIRAMRNRDPVFGMRCEAALALNKRSYVGVVRAKAMSADPDAYKAAQWMLERRFPKEYGASSKLEVTAKPPEEMSEGEIVAELKGALAALEGGDDAAEV